LAGAVALFAQTRLILHRASAATAASALTSWRAFTASLRSIFDVQCDCRVAKTTRVCETINVFVWVLESDQRDPSFRYNDLFYILSKCFSLFCFFFASRQNFEDKRAKV